MTDTNSDAAAPVVVTTLPSMNPPLFFEIVEDLVYRSNKCDATSFPFLATLQLNTVVYLSYDDLSRDLAAFFAEKEINVIHLGMKYRTASSQWKGISEGMAKETIEYILDQRRHPILVMCKTGVHFAGTMIGCLRRLQNWSLTSTIDKGLVLLAENLDCMQYRNIAGSVKTRFENEQFIELFDVDLVTLPQQLPSWFTVHQRLTEEERIALTRGEFFPGRTLAKVEEQPKKEPPQLDAKTENEVRPEIEEVPAEATETPVLAYQKYFFYLQGPLVSSSVKFSEKKSIIGDDDDD
ncbi:Protein-tyrosine phosphatase-like [Phytophthora cactorum]|nr:Protein-tyrosine phosphatase-like [Phytophthora cactorum]